MPMFHGKRRIMYKLICVLILCCCHSVVIGQTTYDDYVIKEFVKAMERDMSEYQKQKLEKRNSEIRLCIQYYSKSYFQMDISVLKEMIVGLINYAEEDSTLQVHIDMAKNQIENQRVFLKYDSLIHIPYDITGVCEADSILSKIKGASEEQNEEINTLVDKLKEYPDYLSQLSGMFSEEEYKQKIRDDWSDLDLDEIQTNDVGNLLQSFLDKHKQIVQTVCSVPYLEKQMEELKKGIDRMKQYRQMDNEETTGRSLFTHLIRFVDDKLVLKDGNDEKKENEGKEVDDNE